MAALRIIAVVVGALALAAPAAADATSLSPNPARVGDTITATMTTFAGVGVVADFGPLDVLSAPVLTGSGATVTYTWKVACLSADCVPGASPRRIVLPPVRLSRSPSPTAVWPVLTITSRVSAADAAAASPPFRLETQLPRATYRVAPRGLALVLGVVALALLVAAALLMARELARRQRRQEEARLAARSPLERALLFAREAEGRGPVERRQAVGLLARVLGGREERLAGVASELAWSPQKPSPEQVESLVGDVERDVGTQ